MLSCSFLDSHWTEVFCVFICFFVFFVLPEIKYSWVFNGQQSFLRQDARRFVSQRTGNLYIAKVEASDVGNYTCAVRNMMTNATVFSSPTPVVVRRDGEHPPFASAASWLSQALKWHRLSEGGRPGGDKSFVLSVTLFLLLLRRFSRHPTASELYRVMYARNPLYLHGGTYLHNQKCRLRRQNGAQAHAHTQRGACHTHAEPHQDRLCVPLQIWAEADM